MESPLVKILWDLLAKSTLDEACAQLAQIVPVEQVHAARKEIEKRIQSIRLLKDPPTLTADGVGSWYPGPSPSDRFWPAYLTLLKSKKWGEADIDALDKASTKIVSLLQHPGLGAFQTRGLVVGYVQSGKTANFTAVIAKAADAGYRMFIVLSGTTNKLRGQTQDRLDAELVTMKPELWVALTDSTNDFRGSSGNANAFLTTYANQKTICVVKKNPGRLANLLKWLRSANESVIRSCPILMIDDEADQASVNTSKDPNRRTRINALMVDILKTLPKVAYVGYTATPFANVFIDPDAPEDLYPRDFITSLPKPTAYFGPERIFGRDRNSLDEEDEATDGMDVIRNVPDSEVPFLRPATASSRGAYALSLDDTPSLATAIRYFWMATAARQVRDGVPKHSTMLVHTSQYADVHTKFRDPLIAYQKSVVTKLEKQDAPLITALRKQWEEEQSRVAPGSCGCSVVTFDQVLPKLVEVVRCTQVLAENYLAQPEDRLVYGGEPGTFIVIGGNILARGLTLEGLVTSFFVRSANAYDTLLQMGRWFGYRPKYEDLPRIWMTDELRGYFFDLATVEQEIRHDIGRYDREHLTPLEFAPRIRTHPQLMITSQLKMQHATECELSYSEAREQTTHFRRGDHAWLRSNLDSAISLIANIRPQLSKEEPTEGTRWVFRGVPAEPILKFIKAYRFHEKNSSLRNDALVDYIQDENVAGALKTWNVVVITQQKAVAGIVDLKMPKSVNLIRRLRMKNIPGDDAYIKALMSPPDMVADLDLTSDVVKGMDQAAMRAVRAAKASDVGLLVLYPISKDSKARPDSKTRCDMSASEHVMGLALVFPKSKRPLAARKYLTADLSHVPQEEVELPDEEGEEAAQ